MKTKKETFASVFQAFQYHYDLRPVFNDFLTMSICAVTQNLKTGKSYYEDLYLETIDKYKNDKLRFEFPKLFALLINEMQERVNSDSGNDVLGEFYEVNLTQKGLCQFFTPWSICIFMAKAVISESEKIDEERPLRILEPACGSGRMLLAAGKVNKCSSEYYGIEIDQTCVKMTALNLFLNGMFHSEVLCADALIPEDFRGSYRISLLPLGIFKTEEKEQSLLWHLLKNSWHYKEKKEPVKLPSELQSGEISNESSSQLTLF